ncbi:MAG: calcium-translocating P-type ATPase, PMCA-type [Bacillota bacterium]|nr:calcium-translocating P-type ATPase, PMCA-type [Bacillota bacterium]
MTEKNMSGLTQMEAEERLRNNGKNVLSGKKREGALKIFIDQFKDLIMLVLISGALISVLLGETVDSLVIMLIVVINATMGFIQEYRTERSLEALQELSAPICTVVRDGERKNIQVSDLVMEDIVILGAGNRVPADCKIVSDTEVSLNESILTGESVPVIKSYGDMVYMGTGIASGHCIAKVDAVGMGTRMGAIAEMLDTGENETPLKKRLNKIGKMLVGVSIGVCILIAFAGIYYGESLNNVFFSAVSLAVAAIPEGLPATVTLCLAIGVRKMLKRNALVRKLPAVETLGCTTVICSDKTGTLTKNKMTTVLFFAGGRETENAEAGGKAFKTLHTIGLLCNDENTSETAGDPTEMAIYSAAKNSGCKIEGYVRGGEVSFNSQRKSMSVAYEKDGEYFLFVKGAWDRIIPKCTKILTENGEQNMTPRAREQIENESEQMAEGALRVMAFAYKKKESSFQPSPNDENELVFVGLEGMMDPPRPEAEEAIQRCYRAGIRPVMITGDHKITAAVIAERVGIKVNKNGVMTGDEIDALDEKELQKRTCEVSVYARVTPEHKLRIVRALKNMGNVVAMTGDGVNDAPALKEADIGVAMGKNGTDVAKEASTVILTDDNFATIVAAVEEGRTIYDNIRKFIRYLLACNLGEILLMGCAAFMGLPVPLLPIQILWVNLVTDGLPALALGMCRGEKEIMDRPPRNPRESIFAGGLGGNIIFSGLIIGSAALIAFVAGFRVWRDLEYARTACFAVLITAELIFAFECRQEKGVRVHITENKYLCLSVGLSFAMMIAVMYVPPIARLFSVTRPTENMWLMIIILAAIESTLNFLLKPRKKGRKVITKKVVA